ncbi:MAG: histidine phosphatase family protein [Patescibacteria group bacterium]|nr:histidine phosphatase family protein [Patescibacteria group bacterium]
MRTPRILSLKSLVLVRHGESVLNRQRPSFCFKDDDHRKRVDVFNDRQCPLTDLGRRQARAAGRGLRKLIPFPAQVMHSGFTRTLQTAQELLGAYPKDVRAVIPLSENNLVRERDSGYMGFMTGAEVAAAFPWNREMWRRRDPFTVVPVGGESLASMCEGRLFRFLEELQVLGDESRDISVVVVSHGRSIQCLRYLLEGWSHDRMNDELRGKNHPPNCSATSYIFDSLGRAHLQFAHKVFSKRP